MTTTVSEQKTILARSTTDGYFNLIERAGDGIAIIQDGVFKLVNSALVRMFGRDKEELLGMPFTSLLTLDSHSLVLARYQARLAGKKVPSIYEAKAVTKNGEVRDIEVNAALTEYEGRAADEVIIRDITERKQAEELFKTMSNSSPIGIYIVQDGKFQYVNPQFQKLTGYSEDELLGMDSLSLVLPDDRNMVRENAVKMLKGERSSPYEYSVANKAGETRWIMETVTSVQYQGGRAALGNYMDITEYKRAEEALRESEEKYRSLFEEANDAIFLAATDTGYILDANRKAERLLGRPVKEIIGLHQSQLHPPDKADYYKDKFRKHFEAEHAADFEAEVIREDGTIVPVYISAGVIQLHDRKVIQGIFRDITERRKREQLQHDENCVLTLLGQGAELSELLDAIVRLGEYHDPSIKGSVLLFDPSRECLVHASAPSLPDDYNELLKYGLPIGPNVGSCGTAAYLRERVIVTDIENSPLFKPFEEAVKRAISSGLLSVWSQPIISSNGDLLGTIANYSNKVGEPNADSLRILEWSARIAAIAIERKRAEEREKQLQQELNLASRLASIGEMASGVAHEINNPLTGVIGFSQLLMRQDIPDGIRDDLQVINNEAQRVAKIVGGLLTFARQHKPGREHVDINEIISRALELRSYEMEVNSIQVVTRLAPDLPQTVADASQLQQVFLNIILNAEKEMIRAHNKGKLSVKTEKVGDTIRVSFADDGPGISTENLDKIFNPFFTTREVGDGTGLGLSICHGIIAAHNGRIYAKSKYGRGATFIVELPIVADAKLTAKVKAIEEEPRKQGGAKILVVDDETAILAFLKRLLTEQGYEVATINRAEAALETLHSEKYDLILLDIKMPVISGIQLYRHIEEIDPALAQRVMFITGDVMETTTRDFLDKTKASHITKPINIEGLKKEIHYILTRELERQPVLEGVAGWL